MLYRQLVQLHTCHRLGGREFKDCPCSQHGMGHNGLFLWKAVQFCSKQDAWRCHIKSRIAL